MLAIDFDRSSNGKNVREPPRAREMVQGTMAAPMPASTKVSMVGNMLSCTTRGRLPA